MNVPSRWPTILATEPSSSLSDQVVVTDPQVEAVDPSRVRIELMMTSNRLAFIEFRVRLEVVEVWFWERIAAIFDRERLRAWLANPVGWLAEGEVTFAVDPRPSGDRVTVALPEVLAWTLSAGELGALRGLL